MTRKVKKSDHCANCETPLSGENYCPECGQLNNIRKPNFWSFIGESISNFFAFDSKFFVTIYLLFRHPGKLAKEFCNGRRVKYMPPIRLYFVASIVLLFINKWDGNREGIFRIKNNSPNNQEEVSSKNTEETDTSSIAFNENEKIDSSSPSENDQGYSEMLAIIRQNPDISYEEVMDSIHKEESYFNEWVYNLMVKGFKMKGEDFKRYVASKTFWILFFFLPLFAIWLKVIYIRRDFYYLDHLFFALYTQSAFFIILSLSLLIRHYFGFQLTPIIGTLAFGIYLPIALGNFYDQGFFKTIMKFILLNLGFIFFAIIFMLLALFVSFIFY